MLEPAIIVLTQAAMPVALRLADTLGGEVHGLSGRVKGGGAFDDAGAHIRNLFYEGRPIVALMASGAVVRLLAPALGGKRDEPPVLCVAEDGSAVVPLLGGHHGANDLARRIGKLLGVAPAVTTAGDLRFGVALDMPPTGLRLANPDAAKAAMARLLAGETARLDGETGPLEAWLSNSSLPVSPEGTVVLRCDSSANPAAADLLYVPQVHHIGMGCERGADTSELAALLRATLSEAGIAPASIAALHSIDLKADEAALHELAAQLAVPVRFHTAAALEAVADRLENPSEVVFAEVGCHGVAEGAALVAAGPDAHLSVAKRKSQRATVAIARSPAPVSAPEGRARGSLAVIGIGPGSEAWRSPEASALVRGATDLVGYSLYLDLLGTLVGHRTRHDFDLGREEDRVRHALELAGEGRDVALVCSGDAGIYAMATLVFELLDGGGLSDGAQRVSITVAPGISALQAAAARVGAPLGHDFCTISLSDLLTPWPDIQRRVKAAAEGDFVIAFYNPVSRRRRTQLAFARDVLLAHRPADTPVVLATNLGREGETVRIVPLSELQVDDVDMLTVVIVGSSNTRTVSTGDGRVWAFTPRGYAAKPGTGLAGPKEAAR